MENFIKCRMDLEATSTLLTKILENLNAHKQDYKERQDRIGMDMYNIYSKRFTIFNTCKENIDFVIKVLTDYISHQVGYSSLQICYTPRKQTFLSDIGKYQTETLKAKRTIVHLSWIASMCNDEELKYLCIESVEKLNYVYVHIAKTYNNYRL